MPDDTKPEHCNHCGKLLDISKDGTMAVIYHGRPVGVYCEKPECREAGYAAAMGAGRDRG